MTFFYFFFNDTATTEIYTLSLHDALPICPGRSPGAETAGTPSAQSTPSTQAARDVKPGERSATRTRDRPRRRSWRAAARSSPARLISELKDPCEHQPQIPPNILQPRDLAPLRVGESLAAPAQQLPVADVAPLQPLAIDALRALDRRVIKDVRLRPSLQQRRVVLPAVTQ